MKIAVLCGGVSTEREISLKTSAKVAGALSDKGHDVIMTDIFFGEEHVPVFHSYDYEKKAEELRKKSSLITDELIEQHDIFGPNVLEICKKSDIVFIGLHGRFGEDGTVQKALDCQGIKYTGSGYRSSAYAMDKAQTKKLVSPYIRMPKGSVLTKGFSEYEHINLPCVIKPNNGGSSIGVFIVQSTDELKKSVEEGFLYDSVLIAEEYIKGRELTQAVIDGKAYPPVEICPDNDSWYDYTSKYSGKTKEICPADIPEDILNEMSASSVKFGEILGLEVYYRVDYLLNEQGVLYALEANSLPGMTDTSLIPQEAAACKIGYPELCEMIIDISLKKYGMSITDFV